MSSINLNFNAECNYPSNSSNFPKTEFDKNFFKSFVKEDAVESVTRKIFFNLLRLIGRKDIDQLEKAFNPQVDLLSATVPYSPNRRRNYDGISIANLKKPLQIRHIVRDIFSTISRIFIGRDFTHSKNNKAHHSIDELSARIRRDRNIIWEGIKKNYAVNFHQKMDRAFSRADLLVKEKKQYAFYALCERITLVSGTILAVFGKIILKNNRWALMGLTISGFTSLFMIVHYGIHSFKQAKLLGDLNRTVRLMENDAAKYRTTPYVFPSDQKK